MHTAAILKDRYEPVPLLPGAYLVLFTDDELLSIEARIAGLRLCDTLAIFGPGRRSRFAFLFRAPSNLTVAEQVLATGTGGLNIQASRLDGRRWPTNVAFLHTPTCTRAGKRLVASNGHHPAKRGAAGVWSGQGGGLNGNEGSNKYMGEAGLEAVEAWSCAPDCLAHILDIQSGDRPSTLTGRADPSKTHGHPSSAETASWYSGGAAKDTSVYADSGGASRFYLQFAGEPDFFAWVRGLINPKDGPLFDT